MRNLYFFIIVIFLAGCKKDNESKDLAVEKVETTKFENVYQDEYYITSNDDVTVNVVGNSTIDVTKSHVYKIRNYNVFRAIRISKNTHNTIRIMASNKSIQYTYLPVDAN